MKSSEIVLPLLNTETRQKARILRPLKGLRRAAVYVTVLSLVVGLGLPVVGLMMPQRVEAAGWWNEDYRYRQIIEVVKSGGGQSNVYIEVTLDTSDASKFTNDCADIRFISQSGQLLPHHLVSGCGSNTTVFQVLFSSLIAGDSVIYVYHGNPQASDMAVGQTFNNQAASYTATPGSTESSAGPVAYWKFDEGFGSTTRSSTSADYPATIEGQALWQSEDQCIEGRCLYFDGSDTMVLNVTDHAALEPGLSDFGWSLWFKTDRPGDLFTTANNNAFAFTEGYGLTIAGWPGCVGRLFFSMSDGVDREAVPCPEGRVDDSRWHHVAVTVERGSQIRIYVDGRLGGQQNTTMTGSIGHTWLYLNPNIWEDYFNGQIDGVKFFHQVRSQQQIQADYIAGAQSMNRQQGNLTNGLVGQWKMDEVGWSGVSGEVGDSSGNGNDGQAANGATTGTGKFGYGGVFDGVDDYYTVPISSGIQSVAAAGSVGGWVYYDGNYADLRTIIDVAGTGDTGLVLFSSAATGTNRPRLQIGNGGAPVLLNAAANLSSNTWHHVMGVWDGSNALLYINGQLNNQIAVAPMVSAWRSDIHIGVNYHPSGNWRFHSGRLDDLRLYNRALSRQEIGQLYNYGPGPAMQLEFEEGVGATSRDLSGNGHDATLTSTWTDGKYGGGLRTVSATGARVLNGPYLGEKSFTMMAWVKSTQTASGQQRIMGAMFDNGDDGWVWFNFNGGNPFLEYNQNDETGGWMSTSGVGAADGAWHHMAAVFDRELGRVRIVVDGRTASDEPIETTGGWGNPNSPEEYRVGYQNAWVELALDGSIDGVRVYDYARTQGQIVEDMMVAASAKASPVAHWKFDEGQGQVLKDSGMHGIDGSMESGAERVDGVSGGAIMTDGTDSGFASIPDHEAVDFDFNQDFSVSFWMKDGGSGANYQSIVEKWEWAYGYPYIFRWQDNTILFGRWDEAAGSSTSGTTLVNDGEWHHVVGTKQGARLNLYIDGVLQGTDIDGTGPATTNDSPIYIGARGGLYELWQGSLDELKIYNVGLTAQQVAVDYNQLAVVAAGGVSTDPLSKAPVNAADSRYCVPGDTAACAAPVGEWDFEEGSGSTLKDISGNGHNGTLANGPAWTIGKLGSALDFNGNDSVVSMGDVLDVVGSQMSISAWVKPRSFVQYSGIVAKLSTGGNYRLVINDVNGIVQYGIRNSGGTFETLLSTKPLVLNEWSHIEVVQSNATTATIYINGIPAGTKTNFTVVRGDTTTPLSIGYNSNNGAGFDGAIDQVRIYDYARTVRQVAWDYSFGKPVIHYKFNECQGGTVHDSGSLQFHAVLHLGSSGQTTRGTCNQPTTAWGLGKMGRDAGAMSFDGLDDYVVADYDTNPELRENYSLSAWIKPANMTNDMAIIGYDFGPELAFYADANGSIALSAYDGYSEFWPDYHTWSPSGLVTVGQWQHVAATVSGTTVKIYYNGRLVKTNQLSSTYPSGWQDPILTIGQTGADWMNQWFDGMIDDLQIYNYALTDEQMKVVYNGGAVRWGP